jgi:hypothetical protein
VAFGGRISRNSTLLGSKRAVSGPFGVEFDAFGGSWGVSDPEFGGSGGPRPPGSAISGIPRKCHFFSISGVLGPPPEPPNSGVSETPCFGGPKFWPIPNIRGLTRCWPIRGFRRSLAFRQFRPSAILAGVGAKFGVWRNSGIWPIPKFRGLPEFGRLADS